jgi:hypothetical protein
MSGLLVELRGRAAQVQRSMLHVCMRSRNPTFRAFGGGAILALFVISAAFGQVSNPKKFSAVPKDLRERLIERLNSFIESEATKQFENKYALLSQRYIASQVSQNLTKANYLEAYALYAKSDKAFLGFKPTSVKESPKKSGRYEIEGRVMFRRGAKEFEEEQILEAVLENGDWYFSDWLTRVE